eukprot:TRINITY_DN61789_c0_g2_i1.p1 TRINITY_DN61789_c0_g2~~TRINITY_DN61789_c0_g2_i1.p1  ORF type:complete len:157 (+),score=1.01 TRINITY_DN61789_c0_g2_i1:243-713(+)
MFRGLLTHLGYLCLSGRCGVGLSQFGFLIVCGTTSADNDEHNVCAQARVKTWARVLLVLWSSTPVVVACMWCCLRLANAMDVSIENLTLKVGVAGVVVCTLGLVGVAIGVVLVFTLNSDEDNQLGTIATAFAWITMGLAACGCCAYVPAVVLHWDG